MFSVRGSTARANTCRIWMTIHSSYHQENLSIIIEGWSCQIQTSSKSPPSWYIWPAVCRAPATRLSAPPRGCSHSERQSLKPHLFIGLHFNLGPTIIIIIICSFQQLFTRWTWPSSQWWCFWFRDIPFEKVMFHGDGWNRIFFVLQLFSKSPYLINWVQSDHHLSEKPNWSFFLPQKCNPSQGCTSDIRLGHD